MGRIQLLDDDVINKIAAGEVVERPASVVKELVENAIDAGATAVTVALELGGTRRIVVADNGAGMPEDDATAALRRHATSKIHAADDLYRIATMGFRGEALASIAAVSRFSLTTVERGAAAGVKVTLSDTGEQLVLPFGGAAGTSISVENLFYNMPVRAKFLKAPATELSHCLELVQAFALCHPAVAFTVTHNGREHFHVTAGVPEAERLFGEATMRERALAVLGKDAAQLEYVRSASRFGELEALVSPPGLEKATGKNLYMFVNGRWVKDKVLRYGILRGYHSHLLKGRFPVAVVHLHTDPALVDVNVHPAKTEVRFQYPEEVQSLIALAIRDRLRQATWAAAPESPNATAALSETSRGSVPAPVGSAFAGPPPRPLAAERPLSPLEGAAASSRAPRRAPFAASVRETRSFQGAGRVPFDETFYAAPVHDKAGLDALLASPHIAPAAYPSAQEPDFIQEAAATGIIPWDELQYLGAMGRCYLFFAAGDRLLVLDQHAFHERVLFERLARDESLLKQSQKLLVPEAVELGPVEIQVLRKRQEALASRGFAYELEESGTTVLVRAVPSLLAGRDLAGLFADLGREVGDMGDEPTDSNAEMARLILAKTACHAAVRAGEELPENELRQLLAEASTVDFYHNCPHGRRVFRWWSQPQVARWFDR